MDDLELVQILRGFNPLLAKSPARPGSRDVRDVIKEISSALCWQRSSYARSRAKRGHKPSGTLCYTRPGGPTPQQLGRTVRSLRLYGYTLRLHFTSYTLRADRIRKHDVRAGHLRNLGRLARSLCNLINP